MAVKAEVVLNCLYKKRSRNEEAQRNGITLHMVDNIIYKFQQIKQVSKNIQKSINLRSTKIIKRHIKCLSKYIEEKSEKGFTLESARNHLVQRFSNIGNTCLPTISRVFHDKLGLSYKKLGNTNPKRIAPENRANQVTWCKIIMGLIEKNFYLIFLDEFLIYRNTINTYGWTKAGMPGRLFWSR